jgi:hypothetical protein
MLGKFTLSLVAVLLLSCGAFASVGQTQGFAIGAFNDVVSSGCVGSAEGGNMVTVGHAQKLSDVWHGITIRQEEKGALMQNAKVVGSRGSDVVGQNGSVEGTQSQYARAGYSGTRTDEQTLNANLETLTTHKGAVGRVMSEQSVVGSQSQRQTTPSGFSEASQSVQVDQLTEIRGGSYSNVKVNNGVDVSLSQSNFVTGTH